MNTLGDYLKDIARPASAAAPYLRGLSSADQEDVLQDALLAAWEEREGFDALRPGPWFAGIVKRSKEKLRSRTRRERRREAPTDALSVLLSDEDPARAVDAIDEAERLNATFTEDERRAADLLTAGQSVKQVALSLGMNRGLIKNVKKRLRRIAQLQPEIRITAATARAEDSDSIERAMAPIDHQIEKLLRRPSTEKADCPICWRCSWFEGLLPINYKAGELADAEVTEAIKRVELRKIDIANGTTPRDLPNDWPKVEGDCKRVEFFLPYNTQIWLGSFWRRFKGFSIEKQMDQLFEVAASAA